MEGIARPLNSPSFCEKLFPTFFAFGFIGAECYVMVCPCRGRIMSLKPDFELGS